MKYLALDIETTGLDPQKDQILQIGMVVDDTENPKPVEELPKLNLFIKHERYEGSSFALAMNTWILDILNSTSEPPEGSSIVNSEVLSAGVYLDEDGYLAHTNNPVLKFLFDNFKDLTEKITVAGKNAAGFDVPFLPDAITNAFDHRVIDVGSMYLRKEDKKVPGLKTCLSRASLLNEVSHDALDDALDVVKLVRYHFGV